MQSEQKRAPEGLPQGFSTRAITPRPTTIREDDRSVEFVISSEDPARVFDWDKFDVVEEVLLMKGLVLPANKQTPFLDSHNRESVSDVLGSMREFVVAGNIATGRAYFSRKQKAFDAWQDVRDGHITDVSVGYVVTDAVWIPEGTTQVIDGRAFTGPLKVSRRWELREVSLTPIGADPNAKARSAQPEKHVTDGLPAGTKISQEETTVEKTEVTTPNTPVQPPAQTAVDLEAARAEAAKNERIRITEIRTACTHAGMITLADELIEKGVTADEARKAVIEAMGKAAKPISAPRVEAGPSSDEKFRAAAVDGIVSRAGVSLKTPAAGHEDFKRMSLLRTAEACLEKAGIKTRGMSAMEIAGAALGLGTRGAYAIVGSTADFANILYDAANKSIQKAYEEAPRQWNRFCRKAFAADFKTLYRPQMSEASDLDLIDENGEYSESKFNERSENYSVLTYGKRFTISRKAIVNDDLDAFSRIPRAFGSAAQRKIEKLVFAILTGNPNMSDAKNLFHADHANSLSGAAFSATTVQTLMAAMRKQKGFGEDTAPLDIMGKFLIVPEALAFAADIVCASSAYPVAEYSAGTVNPIRNRGIEVISSPLLDADSALKHYMAADPNAFDTIEVAFLEGNENPVLEQIEQTDVDGRIYRVRIDVGAKALDWRGLAVHAGQ